MMAQRKVGPEGQKWRFGEHPTYDNPNLKKDLF